MPSQLYDNDAITFICARNFVYSGVTYAMGEDFPNQARDIETLVRARYIIPVVDDRSDKPRHWFREIQERDLVLRKLGLKPEKKNPAPEDLHVAHNRLTLNHPAHVPAKKSTTKNPPKKG